MLDVKLRFYGPLLIVVLVFGGCSQTESHLESSTTKARFPEKMASSSSGKIPLPTRFIEGMTLSCPTWGPIWGSEKNAVALDELKNLGVEWVTYHPYARINSDGEVRFQRASSLAFMHKAIGMSREKGFKVMLKPHLSYWGSFSWRGAITFKDEKNWQRFFKTYESFILDQALFAEEKSIPLFVVGVELDATAHRENEWRALIAKVRKVYHGQITFASNWDAFEKLPFWDVLDVVGVQGYFPLSTKENPSLVELEQKWSAILHKLEVHARKYGKKVLFTELGYPAALHAAKEPWKPAIDENGRKLREQLMDIALTRLQKSSFVLGAFWWKWMPGSGKHDDDFSMKDAEARRILRRHWAEKG